MKRVKTGIPGMDELIDGGIPRGSTLLLSGTPGTGKTIFALQYLHNGSKYDQKGLYVTFEEKEDALREQARQFGWKLDNKYVKIWHIPTKSITDATTQEIMDYVKSRKIERLVIDSLSTLAINIPTLHTNQVSEYGVQHFVYQFLGDMQTLPCTTLLISQTTDSSALSRDGVSEFVCDGVVNVVFESLGGQFSRNLLVRKMRRTDHDEDIHPLEIGPKGLVVHSLD